MNWPIVLLIAMAVVVLAGLLRLKARSPNDEQVWPYFAKKPLTQPEQVLYFRLIKALPEHIVLAQVQLSRILGIKKGHNFHAWNNRVNRMSADFVVCQKDATVVAVLELDDSTHAREDRKSADMKKNKALESAGVPIIRWRTKSLPDEATIRVALLGEN